MHRLEAAQELKGCLGQRYEAIPVAFGVAYMDAGARGVDVADLQPQPFAQTQAEAVEGKEEYAVAENTGGGKDAPGLFDGDDVRQALTLGRFDQAGRNPGFLQDVLGVELQAVEVEFDCGSGMCAQQLGEVVRPLRLGQVVDLVIEVRPDAANGARIRFDGLGLQALELEVLEVGLILPVKVGSGWLCHASVSSRLVAKSLQHPRRSVREDYVVLPTVSNSCRVAASSNPTVNRTAPQRRAAVGFPPQLRCSGGYA